MVEVSVSSNEWDPNGIAEREERRGGRAKAREQGDDESMKTGPRCLVPLQHPVESAWGETSKQAEEDGELGRSRKAGGRNRTGGHGHDRTMAEPQQRRGYHAARIADPRGPIWHVSHSRAGHHAPRECANFGPRPRDRRQAVLDHYCSAPLRWTRPDRPLATSKGDGSRDGNAGSARATARYASPWPRPCARAIRQVEAQKKGDHRRHGSSGRRPCRSVFLRPPNKYRGLVFAWSSASSASRYQAALDGRCRRPPTRKRSVPAATSATTSAKAGPRVGHRLKPAAKAIRRKPRERLYRRRDHSFSLALRPLFFPSPSSCRLVERELPGSRRVSHRLCPRDLYRPRLGACSA